MLAANASEVVKLVPDIAVKLGTIPPPRTGGQRDKTQFYEAVTQFFIAISREAPLLLLLDDMEYVDQPSAELWEYLVRSTSNLQILTVCSTPPEAEIESKSQLEQVLMKFNKERLLETIPVRGLSKDETTTFVRQTFGEQTISPEFADLIYQRTGGNPFFVEEVLRSLVADGTIFRVEKGWDRKPIQDIVIPKTVKTALKARLSKLDSESMAMLEWAATMGSEFDFDVLKEASQTGEDKLLDQIGTAVSQGLLVEVPNEQSRLRFADERVRELLLEEVIQLKRRRYHLKIAEALEKVYAQNLDSNSEMIATHFAQCGDKERTIKYSIMAGDYVRSIHAYGQATDSYRRALDKLDVSETKQRASLLEKLADSYHSAAQFSNSVQRYEEALSLLEKSQDNTGCARISAQLAELARIVRGPEEAVRFLKDAMKYVQEDPESSEAASLYARLGFLLGLLDRLDEAEKWSERAVEAGEKSRNFAAVSEALTAMANFLLDTGRIDEGLPKLEKSLQVAKQHGMYFQTAYAYVNLAAYAYPRDLSAAGDFASQWLVLAKQENMLPAQANALAWLAVFDWLRGSWAEASEEFGEAFEIKNRLGFRFVALNAEAERAELFLSVGDLDRAQEFCRLALGRGDEEISAIVVTNLALGKLRFEQGRVEEAKAHFEACVNAFKDHEFTTEPLWHIETLLHLTGIYMKSGQSEKARMMADWAKRLAKTLRSNAGLAMALQAEANLYSASGDLKGAQEAYQESLSLWGKAGWPYYQAKALVEYSEAMAQANLEESKKRLEQAMGIFKKLGAKRDLEKAEAKLATRT
jgi:tetratricopeptide (TPR) repeat protein